MLLNRKDYARSNDMEKCLENELEGTWPGLFHVSVPEIVRRHRKKEILARGFLYRGLGLVGSC